MAVKRGGLGKGLDSLIPDTGLHFTGYEAAILLVGMVTAFVVSILAIKFLMGYIKKNNFKPFGYYRIALGVLVLAYFIFLG